MEKKRRARINQSLDELKRIVVDAEKFVSIYQTNLAITFILKNKLIQRKPGNVFKSFVFFLTTKVHTFININ